MLVNNKYRPDIDGLRGIAVVSVMLFHAFPSWIPGGFVGVDVFFVISGYLIANIVFQGLSEERFSFVDFYKRRIRRIFPSLILVLLASIWSGQYLLLADEYRLLGKHVSAGGLFVSNFALMAESGYFDTAAETKPLLHLWSLGVEEQFYLFFPALVCLLWKRRDAMQLIMIIITVISFAYGIFELGSRPAAAYFSPLSRIWECMIGVLLAYYYHNNRPVFVFTEDCASYIGIVLLALSFVFINQSVGFPGWAALGPTLGAAALISASQHSWINRKILANKVLVFIGVISFPLYLWHWLCLSLLRILYGFHTPSIGVTWGVLFLSFFLAYLTYLFVEKPIRFGSHATIKVWFLVALMGFSVISGYMVFLKNGYPERRIEALNKSSQSGWNGGSSSLTKEYCGLSEEASKQVPVCASDNREPARLALVGDSKAMSLFPGLLRTSHENYRWMFIGGTKGETVGVPVLSDAPLYKRGQRLAHLGMDSIVANQDIKVVAINTAARELLNLKNNYSIEDLPQSPHFEEAKKGLLNYVQRLVQAKKIVVLVIDNPTLPDPKKCISRTVVLSRFELRMPNKCSIPLEQHLELSQDYRRMLESIAETNPKMIKVFDTVPILCNKNYCESEMNGRLLYEYSDHVSDYGAQLIGEQLNDYVKAMPLK